MWLLNENLHLIVQIGVYYWASPIVYFSEMLVEQKKSEIDVLEEQNSLH